MAKTFETALTAAARALRKGGIEMPELDARLLLCHAAGLTHEALIARGRETIPPGPAAKLDAYLGRRLRGEPVSRIRGSREFYGRTFLVDRHTLDPRPDTETLIEAALDLVARNGWRTRPIKLLDVGTGTGCILLTLLAELPQAEGIGTDISGGALGLAAENARRLGLEGRARFIAADWLEGVAGHFDLVLSNPPYVPSGEIAGLAPEVSAFDPRGALDGGPDGLAAYRRIATRAEELLSPDGVLIVEIGESQAEAVRGLFRAAGLQTSQGVCRDLAGRPRCVVARVGRGGAERRRPPKIRLENHNVQGRFVSADRSASEGM